MDAESPMEVEFLREQERRRKKNLSVDLYDVLGWSLPALSNLDMVSCEADLGNADLMAWASPHKAAPIEGPALAYLIPWGGSASAHFLSSALQAGLSVHTSTYPFTQKGREFGEGTLIVKRSDNDLDLHTKVSRVARQTGAEVVATETSWTESGSNFGSSNVQRIPRVRIALAWDEPTKSLSAGATRFWIEQKFGYPVTPVRTEHLKEGPLDDFHVVILPDGGDYERYLDKSGVERLKSWVGRGGVLVGFGRANRFLSEQSLLATSREYRANSDDGGEEKAVRPVGSELASLEEYEAAIQPRREEPSPLPGVILRAEVDRDHWLAAGLAQSLNFIVTGGDIYKPLRLGDGVNVVRFAEQTLMGSGGHVWQDTRQQLAFKPVVMAANLGKGQVIGMTSDPSFRGFIDGLTVLMGNMLFRAPAYTGE